MTFISYSLVLVMCCSNREV